MLTGTPLDLTPFGGIVAALGWLYWLFAAGAVWLVWSATKARPRRVVYASVAAALFAAPAIMAVVGGMQARARLDRATAHFEMRCKSAGEFIKRTVENVEGVAWLKWRDRVTAEDEFDQFKLNDPFGRDCTAEGCVEQLLTLEPQGGRFAEEVELRRGRYRFVEAADPSGQKFRYTGAMRLSASWTSEGIAAYKRDQGKEPPDMSYRFTTDKTPIERFGARYGVTWDDISTREDREHWIAGGRLQVIDLQTNEVIAERVGYMMDRGLGDRSGFRTPWLEAQKTACPEFSRRGPTDPQRSRGAEGRNFVLRVVQPTGSK